MAASILQDAMFLVEVVFEVRHLDPPCDGGRHWVECQGYTEGIIEMKRRGYTPDLVARVLVNSYRTIIECEGGGNGVDDRERQAR